MVSAICPHCKILLVEATSNANANLGAAVNTAARAGRQRDLEQLRRQRVQLGARATTRYFNHPGVAITVSSGDNGYGVEFPAASPYVTAVGGTTLTRARAARAAGPRPPGAAPAAAARAYEAKPSWQTDTGCAKRTVADVSAVADPNTGVAVYDSTAQVDQLRAALRAGRSSAARAPRRRSSRRSTPWRATRRRPTYGSFPYAHTSRAERRHVGQQRQLQRQLPVHRRRRASTGPTGLGTPNGTGAF